jgi:hypothetical protein
MTWNLWLDDERPCPHEDWLIAKSTEEAKQIVLKNGPPVRMSLDHDLGGDDTSMLFVRWLSHGYFNQMPLWRVHSANPVGKANLESYMGSWARSV